MSPIGLRPFYFFCQATSLQKESFLNSADTRSSVETCQSPTNGISSSKAFQTK